MSIFRRPLAIAVIALSMVSAACGNVLSVSDPTLITDSDIATTDGANAQRAGVVVAFDQAILRTPSGSSAPVFGMEALFTDERMYDSQIAQVTNITAMLDVRDTAQYLARNASSFSDPILGPLTSIVTAAAIAIPGIRVNADQTVRGEYLAQVYALRGFAMVQMAEDLCPGFPINDIRGGRSYYSPSYTTQEALQYAVATLDTALSAGHDSTRFLNLARVLKARALLDLGQYDQAAAAATLVPTDFTYRTDSAGNGLFSAGFNFNPQAVGNREGGNGLAFAASRDPRVPSVFKIMRFHRTADTVSDSLRDQRKYPSNFSAIIVASGVEARLIEAEAALHDNDPATAFSILNTLRATAIAPAMTPLTDPGPATRVDTLFKERAFWLYLTGHRLGDMRRLIHQYARPDSTVFPWGTHVFGVPYGRATSIPFVLAAAQQYNPHITAGCQPES